MTRFSEVGRTTTRRRAALAATRATAIAVLAARLLGGCGTMGPVRISGPENTPLGPPRGECETRQWLDVVATRTSSSATDTSQYASYTYTVTGEGYGIYERQGGEAAPPIPVADALTRIDARAVFDRHEARLEGTRARSRASLYIALGSTALSLGGLATLFASAGSSSDSGVPIAVPLTFLGLSLAGLLAYAIVLPSRPDRAHVGLREQVLLANEDDMGAVMDAVVRHNGRVRQLCGGPAPTMQPATLPTAQPPAQPAAGAFGSGLAPSPQ